eukprot:TRINITY_DN3900_c0_g5_i1.p3 TRINITY_DN3900_c0_g5~~TRINITY_DN3900_c0_g5_i1.p3  ORF type:complete len:205 (-),score=28.10 TRINITY_DN3900_c0_g5_i1:131-745(-)
MVRCLPGYTLQPGRLGRPLGNPTPERAAFERCSVRPDCLGVSVAADHSWQSKHPGAALLVKAPIVTQPSWHTCIKDTPTPVDPVDWSWTVGWLGGFVFAAALPMLLVLIFGRAKESGPPSAVRPLSAEDFWSEVGEQRHAVVMFWSATCPMCQDFLWDFELLYERFEKRRDLVFAKVEHGLREPVTREMSRLRHALADFHHGTG